MQRYDDAKLSSLGKVIMTGWTNGVDGKWIQYREYKDTKWIKKTKMQKGQQK